MDARPEWVPEWVWIEYCEAHRENAFPNEVMQCVIDLRCRCVWDALTARRDANSFMVSDLSDVFFSGHNTGEVAVLLGTVTRAASGIPAWEYVPHSQRRKEGQRIARAAQNLLDALAPLPHGHSTILSPCVGPPYFELAEAITREELENHPDTDSTAFRAGAIFAMQRIEQMLSVMIVDAKRWANSKPPVTQLFNDNAGRLYFMREVTAYFKRQYGTPLRDQTAALTTVMFDCDMDAATVAKLAP